MGSGSRRGSYAKGLSIGIATHFSLTEVDREWPMGGGGLGGQAPSSMQRNFYYIVFNGTCH